MKRLAVVALFLAGCSGSAVPTGPAARLSPGAEVVLVVEGVPGHGPDSDVPYRDSAGNLGSVGAGTKARIVSDDGTPANDPEVLVRIGEGPAAGAVVRTARRFVKRSY